MSERRQTTQRRRTRGFTLTELMTVVAIIGVLAAIAVISARRSHSVTDADAWANNVRNMVNQARKRATATGSPYMMELTPTTLRLCQIPVASCTSPTSVTCASAALASNCGPLQNQACERYAPITAGSDAVTDSWSSTPDAFMNVVGVTGTYTAGSGKTPLSTSKAIFFGPVGSADDVCPNVLTNPPDPTKANGFTVYVRAVNTVSSSTSENQKRRKIVIYGVTGRPRIIDQW